MMKQIALTVIFVFIILPLIFLAIIGADAYLTVTNFSPSKVSLNVSPPTASLSSDNKTVTFSSMINLTTPKAGFIPKAASVTIKLIYNGTTQLGTPIHLTLELGKTITKTINESITLTPELVNNISQGNKVTITVKTNATIAVFGITIPYNFKVPDQTFTIP